MTRLELTARTLGRRGEPAKAVGRYMRSLGYKPGERRWEDGARAWYAGAQEYLEFLLPSPKKAGGR